MTKYLSILVALVVTLFTVNALAFTPPPAPANGFYVYDGTGRMTATQVSALNQKILRISKATNNEFGIAFLQSLDGSAIEDASYSTFRSWGIGKHGLDNGVLIMLSLKEHKSRIETGKGVGGEITDIQAKQILDSMRPALRDGDFYGAFNLALDRCSALLDSRVGQKATNTPTVNPTPAQQQAANQIAQQQSSTPQAPTSTPVAQQPSQQSSGGNGGLIFLLVLLGVGVVGAGIYFLVVLPNQRAAEEENRLARLREAVRQANAAKEAEAARQRQAELERKYSTPIPAPAPVRHTHHTTTSHVQSRPSVPLTPSYTPPPPPAPAYVAPVSDPTPVDNSAALAAAAAAAALAAEQEEERREARRRREEEEEERRAEARQREREAEERRAEARRQEEEDRRRRDEESSSSSSSSSFDWGSSSGGSDSGGGFGGGDSGGGGASSDW